MASRQTRATAGTYATSSTLGKRRSSRPSGPGRPTKRARDDAGNGGARISDSSDDDDDGDLSSEDERDGDEEGNDNVQEIIYVQQDGEDEEKDDEYEELAAAPLQIQEHSEAGCCQGGDNAGDKKAGDNKKAEKCSFCANDPVGQAMDAKKPCDWMPGRFPVECSNCANHRLDKNPNQKCVVTGGRMLYKRYADKDPHEYPVKACDGCKKKELTSTCDVDSILGIACRSCKKSDCTITLGRTRRTMDKRPSLRQGLKRWFRQACDVCYNVQPRKNSQACSFLKDRSATDPKNTKGCEECAASNSTCFRDGYKIPEKGGASFEVPETWDHSVGLNRGFIECRGNSPYRKSCFECARHGNHCRAVNRAADTSCNKCSEIGTTCVNTADNTHWPLVSLATVGFGNFMPFSRCTRCIELGRKCDRQRPCDSCSNNEGDHVCDPWSKEQRNTLKGRLKPAPGPLYYLALGYGAGGVKDVKDGSQLEHWVGPILPIYDLPNNSKALITGISELGKNIRKILWPPKDPVTKRDRAPPHGGPGGQLQKVKVHEITVEQIRNFITESWGEDVFPINQHPKYYSCLERSKKKLDSLRAAAARKLTGKKRKRQKKRRRRTGRVIRAVDDDDDDEDDEDDDEDDDDDDDENDDSDSDSEQDAEGEAASIFPDVNSLFGQGAANTTAALPPQQERQLRPHKKRQRRQELHPSSSLHQGSESHPAAAAGMSYNEAEDMYGDGGSFGSSPEQVGAPGDQTPSQPREWHESHQQNPYPTIAVDPVLSQSLPDQKEHDPNHLAPPSHQLHGKGQGAPASGAVGAFAPQGNHYHNHNRPPPGVRGSGSGSGSGSSNFSFNPDSPGNGNLASTYDVGVTPRRPATNTPQQGLQMTTLPPSNSWPANNAAISQPNANANMGSDNDVPSFTCLPSLPAPSPRWGHYDRDSYTMELWEDTNGVPSVGMAPVRTGIVLFSQGKANHMGHVPMLDILYRIALSRTDVDQQAANDGICADKSLVCQQQNGSTTPVTSRCKCVDHADIPGREPCLSSCICPKCSRASTEILVANDGVNSRPITHEELVGLRAYLCDACTTYYGSGIHVITHAHLHGASRIQGCSLGDANVDGLLQVNSQRMEIYQHAMPGTGCSCGTKLFAAPLCRYHRLSFADAAMRHATNMQKWRDQTFGGKACPGCLLRFPQSRPNMSKYADGPTSNPNGTPFSSWICLLCNDLVLNQTCGNKLVAGWKQWVYEPPQDWDEAEKAVEVSGNALYPS